MNEGQRMRISPAWAAQHNGRLWVGPLDCPVRSTEETRVVRRVRIWVPEQMKVGLIPDLPVVDDAPVVPGNGVRVLGEVMTELADHVMGHVGMVVTIPRVVVVNQAQDVEAGGALTGNNSVIRPPVVSTVGVTMQL